MTETIEQARARRQADKHKTKIGKQRQKADSALAGFVREQVNAYLSNEGRAAIPSFFDIVQRVRDEERP